MMETKVPLPLTTPVESSGVDIIQQEIVRSFYQPNPTDGKIYIDMYPDCNDNLLMLPLPYCCIGCCWSRTTHTVIDDRYKTITVNESRGHCFILPCCRFKEEVYSFPKQVKDIYYLESIRRSSDNNLYQPVLEMKPTGSLDNKLVQFGPNCSREEAKRYVLSMHYFLFGRDNPDYQEPRLREVYRWKPFWY